MYDAVHGAVIMTLVNGTMIVLDAATLAIRTSVTVYTPSCANDGSPCDPLEYPRVDGAGSLYVNAAMQNKLYKLARAGLRARRRRRPRALPCPRARAPVDGVSAGAARPLRACAHPRRSSEQELL